jgi:hypothetical protein
MHGGHQSITVYEVELEREDAEQQIAIGVMRVHGAKLGGCSGGE